MTEIARGSSQAVAAAIEQLKKEADELKQSASALAPLAKESTHGDFAKLGKAIEAAETKLGSVEGDASRGRAVLDEVKAEREASMKALRESLGKDLKAACEAAGLTLRVIQREGLLKLRIPPFGVTIDRDKGSASVEFAQETLATCPASVPEIMAAHRSTLERMGKFDAEAFFASCLRAWKAACATGHAGNSQRVEIGAFMPYLVMEMQGPAFRKAPDASKFSDYSRARFAFDVMRLREARMLIHEGWRMNVGVATGTTASSNSKSKVLWLENRDGEGEYKLNVFFTRQEAAANA